jgi:hypothetical protein
MSEEKNTNTLEENPFSYQQYKNGNISICWKEKEVMILKNKKAEAFLSQISGKLQFDEQMAMAKITGNFKRGNEREGKIKGR